MGANKYEKFKNREIDRSEIQGADYNPRKISASALKSLKENLKSMGLLAPLVWNVKTGTLVSGHQRLDCLDKLHQGKPYRLTVAEVELDEKTEAKANIFLNNQDAQGEWDADKLQQMKDMFDFSQVDIMDMGFTMESADMLGLSEIINETVLNMETQYQPPSEEEKQSFRDAKKKGREDAKQSNADGDGSSFASSDFTVTFIFPDSKSKQTWMENIGQRPNETRLNSKILEDLFRPSTK